jgi:hypothetical protein
MNVKPGSMPAVVEMGPKIIELSQKILGDDLLVLAFMLEF